MVFKPIRNGEIFWMIVNNKSNMFVYWNWGCVFLGKSRSGFPNPKTDHESIKSTLRVDSLDQIQIRIFEIHKLSVFWERIWKKYFWQAVLRRKKNGTQLIYAAHVWHCNWTYVGGALVLVEPLVTYHSMFVIYSNYWLTVFKPVLVMFFVRMYCLLTPLHFPSN